LIGLGLVYLLTADPDDSFPALLVPPGATVERVEKRKPDDCYAHQIAMLATNGADVAAWARQLDLPCETISCTSWSSDARATPPFWKKTADARVNGLDKVRAAVDGTKLTVDWGDYLCAGPN
jgi:hypothetical protein